MTLFGHDVSSYNPDFQPTAGQFVIVKASEGARTRDPSWPVLSARVRAKGALLLAYHFLHSDSTPAAQAANTAAVGGVKSVPLMVDVEIEKDPNGNVVSRPTVAQCAAYVDEARRLGLDPRLVYLPRWYWQELGAPSLQPLIDRGLHLVSSAYPQQGHYPGDNGSGWQAYGGMTPLIWQYSSVPIDADAFKGTLAQLESVLGTTPEDDMALSDADLESIAEKVWGYAVGHKQSSPTDAATIPTGTVLGWLDYERVQDHAAAMSKLGSVLSQAQTNGSSLTSANTALSDLAAKVAALQSALAALSATGITQEQSDALADKIVSDLAARLQS